MRERDRIRQIEEKSKMGDEVGHKKDKITPLEEILSENLPPRRSFVIRRPLGSDKYGFFIPGTILKPSVIVKPPKRAA